MGTRACRLMLALSFCASAPAAPSKAATEGTPSATLDLLLPAPHEAEARPGRVLLKPPVRLSLPEQWSIAVGRYVWLLDDVLVARKAGRVTVVKDVPGAAIRVTRKAEGDLPENGYELKIGSGVIELAASDSGGLFNGLATLAQLIELCPSDPLEVPGSRIRDWPDLATRAVHIDMTCQQHKAPYVERLMRTLARYKVNAILMEYSDMFPFREHRAICRADAFSEEEIRSIRRTAEECNQEIIPFLQCAGHLEYVLTREPYAGLSDGHSGYSYCLANDGVLPFAESLIDEILAQHPGLKRLHVGGDEVGPGACERCAGVGDFHAMYLRHYARIAEHCRRRGVVPLMWTDIMAPFRVQDQPEVVAALVGQAAEVLPREVVGVDWRYRGKDFYVASKLREAGFQAFTAPAARCGGDVFDLPRLLLHMENIQGAFLRAAEWKLAGTMITSWSYRGSPQVVCLPEYAAVAYGWNTGEADVATLLGRFFRQRYGLSEVEGSALAQAALAETRQNVPTALGTPNFDAKRQAWTIPAAKQAEQLISRLSKEEPLRLADSLQEQLGVFGDHDALWQSALQSAKRFQDELRCWDLARRHLEHRLKVSMALARLKSGAKVDDQLGVLLEATGDLREEWKSLYRDVYTPAFLEVELEIRFDAEPGILEAVRRWEGKPTPPKATPAVSPDTQKGLIGHWEFQGDLKDSSGHGHDGTGRNVTFTVGPHGQARGALLFDGRDSLIEVPDAEPLRLGKGDFSLAVWVRPDSPMRTVLGDLVSKFDPTKRRGINFSIAGSACSYSGMSDSRHVHFGIDEGYMGQWEDCGKPWDSNSLVSCLIVYEGELYCGIADAAEPQDAAHVFRWTGGRAWEDCGRLGSDPGHLSVQSMIVHDGKLYAGTGVWWNWNKLKEYAPAHVFVYEGGKSWRDLGQVGAGSRLICLGSYGGELYAGLDRAGGGKCFKYQGGEWVDCGAPDGRNFECLMPLGGQLYAATHGNLYLYGGGARWTCIGHEPYGENQIHSLGVFGGKLHAGCWPSGYILRYEGGERWVSTGRPNATGDNNEVNDLVVHNGKLYGGLIPRAEVYRYEADGNWTLLESLATNTAAKGSVGWCRVNALCSHGGKLWASTGSCTGEPKYVDAEGTLGRVYSLQLGLMVSHERDIGPGWTHLAAVRQGRQLCLYVNGRLSGQAEAPEGRLLDLSNTEPLRIGFGVESYFAGAMADLRLYREALDATQVKSLMLAPSR